MPSINLPHMRRYLGRSLASFNQNKVNGILAESDFQRYLTELGFGDRVSPGGWIFRRTRGNFASKTVVVFPEVVRPGCDYPVRCDIPAAPFRLHTVCATFQQTGIQAFYCYPAVPRKNSPTELSWRAVRLGVPMPQEPRDIGDLFCDLFVRRERPFGWLRYKAKAKLIPDGSVPEEFSKQNLRIYFQNQFYSEVSDVDGIFWGDQFTYPLEIKEKTAAHDKDLGEWFGIDVGPFVKLAYYAAKRGNLNSIFVVREIEDEQTRKLVAWRFIAFEKLATYASWVHRPGGKGMGGGRSAVVRIPKREFESLTCDALKNL
jgi:hypothetical protein